MRGRYAKIEDSYLAVTGEASARGGARDRAGREPASNENKSRSRSWRCRADSGGRPTAIEEENMTTAPRQHRGGEQREAEAAGEDEQAAGGGLCRKAHAGPRSSEQHQPEDFFFFNSRGRSGREQNQPD